MSFVSDGWWLRASRWLQEEGLVARNTPVGLEGWGFQPPPPPHCDLRQGRGAGAHVQSPQTNDFLNCADTRKPPQDPGPCGTERSSWRHMAVLGG